MWVTSCEEDVHFNYKYYLNSEWKIWRENLFSYLLLTTWFTNVKKDSVLMFLFKFWTTNKKFILMCRSCYLILYGDKS